MTLFRVLTTFNEKCSAYVTFRIHAKVTVKNDLFSGKLRRVIW
jgi:hypothetical protein